MTTTTMPPELAEFYNELWQDVSWVYGKWDIFLQLYSDKETIDLLNNTAPSYFRICQDVLLDDTMMAICRLTDPAQTGRKTNLSLQRLVDSVDGVVYPMLKVNITNVLDAVQSNFEFARDHRNRRIAHVDLQTRLNKHPEPLSEITRNDVRDALKAIARVMNTVQRHFENGDTLYSRPIVPDDGKTLLYWLRKGYDNAEDDLDAS